MIKTALLFPGQGSQNADMARFISRETSNLLSDMLNYDLNEIINDPERLNQTKYTQPIIFAVSYSIYKMLDIVDKNISFLVGHSLGEWTAAAVAGCISFEDGLKAVNTRARLMDTFSKNGAMAAILGLSSNEVEKEIKNFEGISIANYNLTSQTVISGNDSSIKEYSDSTKARVIKLKVSGAFHSPYMEEAKKEFKKSIGRLKFNDAKIPIILNSKAKPETDGLSIKNTLVGQLTKPVYFYQSVDYCIKQGVNCFYEIGPSKVLTGLVKKINNSVNIIAAEDIDLKQCNVNNSTNAVTN